MKIQLPKTYSQNDPQWRNKTLGSSGTIGDYGCLMTCVAMMCTYYGHEETPATLNEKLKRNGGYANGNLFVWGAIANIFPDIAYQGQTQTPDALSQTQMNTIKKTLDKGMPVILQIDTVPVTSAFDEHWIMAIDYDGDDFIVQDPWDGATKRITSWGVAPQKLIYAYAFYTGNPVIVPTNPITPPVNTGNQISIEGALFQQLVKKSTQWDIIADRFSIDKEDVTGGQRVVDAIGNMQNEIDNARNDRDRKAVELTSLQGSYSILQTQYTSLQQQYTLLQAQMNKLPSEPVFTPVPPTVPPVEPPKTPLPVDNPSSKPFWESKKVVVTGLTSILSFGLILIQSAQIGPEDNWEQIASKLFSAAAASLGISAVANQYVKTQGAIDSQVIGKSA